MVTAVATICVSATGLVGCGQTRSPVAEVSSAPSADPADPRAQLAARAAAAKDRRFVAAYALTRPGQHGQAVAVTIARDATWRVDIQGGALGGTTDIALVGRPDGQYQCVLNTSPVDNGCVKVAANGRRLQAGVDPQVQYPFTGWLDVLTDPSVAVAVTVTTGIPNVAGTCFAVEPTTVTLAPPIPSSVFCFTDDGTMTATRAAFGTLVISGPPTDPPATASLPGQIVPRAPLQTGAPPATPSSPAGSTATPSVKPTTPSSSRRP